MVDLLTKGGADFSPCGRFRWRLTRLWDPDLPRLCFIMLNPSTADADVDDATTRRVLTLATELGFGRYEAVNLFAFRSVTPKVLREVDDPIGPDNDGAILKAVASADMVVAAWGTGGALYDRDKAVVKMLGTTPLYCLRVTKHGYPWHPLYLRNGLRPKLYSGSAIEGDGE